MKIYSAEQLKPGMTTAARVETENGQILVLENTELTSRLINRIRFYRIPEIAIVEEENKHEYTIFQASVNLKENLELSMRA